jgi:membrane protease YdiL (CAAX protease family)
MSSEHAESKSANPFPFNNLFLIKGYITGRNDFWMYVFGLVAAFIGYIAFQLIMLVPLLAAATKQGIGVEEITTNPNILFNPDAMGMNRSFMLALLMGMFVSTLLFFWLFTRLIQHKPLSSILTGFEKFRWKRYFFAFSTWGFLLVAFTVVSYLMAPGDMELRFDAPKFALLFVVALILVPIQTGTEELLFRGYLMQGFSQLNLAKLLEGFDKHVITRPLISFLKKKPETYDKLHHKLSGFSARFFRNGIFPLILTSVLFGLMHASNPEVKAHGLLLMMPYFIMFGAFLGVLTLLDEGAELAMGVHFANNLFSALLVCTKNSVLQTDAIFYTSVEEPLSELIAWAIMATVCFFIFYKTYKLSNWKLLIR